MSSVFGLRGIDSIDPRQDAALQVRQFVVALLLEKRDQVMTDKADSSFNFYLDKPSNQLEPGQANFNNTLGRTCKVGSFKPNQLGLFERDGCAAQSFHDERFDQSFGDRSPALALVLAFFFQALDSQLMLDWLVSFGGELVVPADPDLDELG